MLEITNEDCMDLMARYPDKYFELDKEYFEAAMKRIAAHTAQTKLF